MRNVLAIVTMSAISLLGSGCTILVSNAASRFSENLSAAVLNQDDPELIRDGLPTLMLTMDSMIEGSPDSPQLLAAGAGIDALEDLVENNLRICRLRQRLGGRRPRDVARVGAAVARVTATRARATVDAHL